MVALGPAHRRASWAATSFRDRVAAHARATGEDGWAMPLPDALRADLDSRVADIANVTGNRWGGMLVAGTFLREFVPDGLPWAHIDIAGPAFHTGGPYGYTAKGGTGVPGPHPPRRCSRTSPRTADQASYATGPSSAAGGPARAGSAAGRRGRASAAGSRRAARRRPGSRASGRACGPRPGRATRRRVHSPSLSTSSTVVSVTVVRGSTNASTPACAAAHCAQVRLVLAVGRRSVPGRRPPQPVRTAPSASPPAPLNDRRRARLSPGADQAAARGPGG